MIDNMVAGSSSAIDLKLLVTLGMRTWPGSDKGLVLLHQSLLYHIQQSTNTLPKLQQDIYRLDQDSRGLQAQMQNLTNELSEMERVCDKLQDEAQEGQRKIDYHVRHADTVTASNSELKEELRKACERQEIATSHDDLVATVSRLEEELSKLREREKHAIDLKERTIEDNKELKKDLEGAQGRENIIKKHNTELNAQRMNRDRERDILKGEKELLETRLEDTKGREDAAQRNLDDKIAKVASLNVSNQDISQRLRAQNRARLDMDFRHADAEDRCRDLQDELSEAKKALKDQETKARDADQACSQAKLEESTLQKQLDDQLKIVMGLKALMEEQKRKLDAKMEDEQAKLTASQKLQDWLTKEVADCHAAVKQFESARENALANATAFEKERTELSRDLNHSRSRERRLRRALAEDSKATAVLKADCQRLSQQVGILKDKSGVQNEELERIREKAQQLESDLKNSHSQPSASEREKAELTGALDCARGREQTLEKALKDALARHDGGMALLRADHSALSQQVELSKEKIGFGLRLVDKHKCGHQGELSALDEANRLADGPTASSSDLDKHSSKEPQRNSVDDRGNQSDTAEPIRENAIRPTSTVPRANNRPHQQLPSPSVGMAPAAPKSPTSPPHTRGLASVGCTTTLPPNANGEVLRATSIASATLSSSKAATPSGNAPGTAFLTKKHARAVDPDGQGESESKRARRRKRHRQSVVENTQA